MREQMLYAIQAAEVEGAALGALDRATGGAVPLPETVVRADALQDSLQSIVRRVKAMIEGADDVSAKRRELREALQPLLCEPAPPKQPAPTGKGERRPPGEGAKFQRKYKGKTYRMTYKEGAYWLVRRTRLNGPFKSPSGAARAVTGKPTNGWSFWKIGPGAGGRS